MSQEPPVPAPEPPGPGAPAERPTAPSSAPAGGRSAGAGPSVDRAAPSAGRPDTDRSWPAVLVAAVPAAAFSVLLAAGCAWLAVLAGVAVLFGAGHALAVGLALTGITLVLRRGRTPGWVAAPMLTVAIVAVAVSATGARVEAQTAVEVRTPRSPGDVPAAGYRTGLGEQLVDLRRMAIPAGRTVAVKARSDLDRTVVALPRGACWNVDVRWRTGWLWLPRVEEHRWAYGLGSAPDTQGSWTRRTRDNPDPGLLEGRLALFGLVHRQRSGRLISRVADPSAPTLRLDLRSLGSSFAVRDYPDDIGPLDDTEWPLQLLPPASPGDRRRAWSSPGRSRESARQWRAYNEDRRRFAVRSKALLSGGCDRRVAAR